MVTSSNRLGNISTIRGGNEPSDGSTEAWKLELLTALSSKDTICFTDGSAMDKNTAFLSILKGAKYHRNYFTGAIITLNSFSRCTSKLRVVDDANFASSAYDMEFIMLCIASWYTRRTKNIIVTECESVMKRIKNREAVSIETKYSTLFSMLQGASTTTIKWTRSHPERRNACRLSWILAEHGIFTADDITINTSAPTILLSTIIHNMVIESKVMHWRDSQNRIIFPDIKSLCIKQRHNTCTLERDRSTSYITPWSKRVYYLLDSVYNSTNRSWRAMTSHCRLIYDKHYYGKNRMKGSKDGTCYLCCTETEDIIHVLYRCNSEVRTNIRQKLLKQTDGTILGTDEGQREIIRTIRDAMFTNEQYHITWSGTWNKDLIDDKSNKCSVQLRDGDANWRKGVRKQMVALTRLHSDTAKDLLKQSMQQVKKHAKANNTRLNRSRISSRTIRASIYQMSMAVRTARERKVLRNISQQLQKERDLQANC